MADETLTGIRYYRTRGGGHRRKMTGQDDIDLALMMYEEGTSIREMCEFFGVAPSTLYSKINRYLEPRYD